MTLWYNCVALVASALLGKIKLLVNALVSTTCM